MPIGSIPTYLLAGGQSIRFGRDKARAPWHGATLLQTNAVIARAAGATVSVVAREPQQYADLGCRTIADLYPDHGPLAGIHTALHDAAPAPHILIMPCDLAGVQPAWLQTLAEAPDAGAEVLLFGAPGEQPLLGRYAATLLPRLEAALQQNRLGVIRFLATCPVQCLPRPTRWSQLRNLNSEQEWRSAHDAAEK